MPKFQRTFWKNCGKRALKRRKSELKYFLYYDPMGTQLEKAINLAKRTGDKVIVVDEKDDSAFVLMDLDEYEYLSNTGNEEDLAEESVENLTEEELLDKINRDIVIWQNKNKEEEIDAIEEDFDPSEEIAKALEKEAPEEEEEDDDDNMYYYGEEEEQAPMSEEKESASGIQSRKSGGSWQISSNVKNRAEEVE